MTPTDLADMPGFNPNVPNGQRSVSEGRVVMVRTGPDRDVFAPGSRFEDGLNAKILRIRSEYPYCTRHGAMLRVSKEGIWRCGELGCDAGCWYPS